MSRFKLYFFIFSLYFQFCSAQISDKRLCLDEKCSQPISRGITMLPYSAPNSYRLSFRPNEQVTIYSKSAGSDEDLWGAEIRGKRGYIPKNLVRETKILAKVKPTILVDTELVVKTKPQVPSNEKNVRPSKVKDNHEVIDGTTIYPQINEDVSTGDSRGIVDEVTETNSSNEIDNKSEEITETSTKTGGYLSEMLGSVLDMVDSTVNHIKAGNDEEEIEKDESSESVTQSSELKEESVESKDSVSPGEDVSVENTVEIIETKQAESNVEIIETKQAESNVETVESDNENFNITQGSVEKSTVDSLDQNPALNNQENVSDPSLLDFNLNKVFAEIKDINSQKDVSNQTSLDSSTQINSQTNVSSENVDPEISIPNSPKVSPDSIEENIEEINNSTETITENSVNQINGKSDNSVSNAQVVPDTLSPLPLDPNIAEKVLNEEKVSENISTLSPNNTENEAQSDNLNDLQKETVTEKPWPFVPTLPGILVESVTSSSEIEEKENKVEGNASQETATESVNIPEYSDLSTKEIHENPIEIETETEALKENTTIDKVSEIISDVNPGTIQDNEIDINEKLDNDTKTEKSDSTPTYSEYVTPYPSLVTEENTQKSEQLQKPEEKYSDFGRENESFKNEYSNELQSDVFSTSTPDNSLNINYEENVKEPEKSEDELKQSEEQSTESNIGLFSYLDKAAENVRNEKHEAVSDPQHCIRNDEYGYSIPMEFNVSSDLFMYLATTAVSVIIFLLGYFALDKSRREGPLVAKLNKLEKEFLILLKEKEILTEQITNVHESDPTETQDFINLREEYQDIVKQKQGLEEQVQTLEKELENSTEVGLELNRMLSELLNSENAGETLMTNIEQLQAQLAEQQEIVSNMKETLSLKETENHELNLELDISNKKVVELQGELDKLLLNVMKVEEEKELQEKNSGSEIRSLKEKLDALNISLEKHQVENLKIVDELNGKLSSSQRNLQLKIKEYDGLKSNMQKIKTVKNANTLESLLEVTSIKAELEQLKTECEFHCSNLQKEKEKNIALEKKSKCNEDEINTLTKRFDETDRMRLELGTKLEVLTTYFKDRETQLQKDLTKYESMWSAKQGEATSTSERVKYLQSEVQNYKSQNESLKEEIVSQEVELKSQISVLEKKVHENWVSARQAERRLEDLKQEAAQLRNRLTLRERALQEDKTHNRMQSPLDQNGEGLHLDTPSSPPLLYNSRDHITKSPAMMGMPPPFLPPPPGAPFLPPPHMPFMPPPPPDMFPGDHRPPPLGRMSSPPLNSRYSPDRRPYSPYDRRSPSPSYDESDFVTSSVHHRRFSPFSGMDHRRMPPPIGKVNGRSGALSSGSGNSNESLDEINHSNSKV